MRIAVLVATFPTLSETFVLDQLTGLLDRGHDVVVFAYPPKDSQASYHEAIDRYGLLGRTCHFRRGHRQRAAHFARLLLRSGVRGMRLVSSVRHGANRAGMRGAHLPYRALVIDDAGPFDVVLAHFGRRGRELAVLRSARVLDTPFATVFHGYDMSRYLDTEGEAVYDDLFRVGDLFLPISDRWRRRLLELGAAAEKISVHRMGVDTSAIPLVERSLGDGETVRLVSIARLVEKKGLEYALKAVSLLSDDARSLEYTIIGDGPLRGSLEELVSELALGERVRFTGWQPREEVQRILRASHVMIAPSVTAADGDQEGIPVSLMEALAGGMPVVTTHHSGIPELVEDDVSGFLVPERDVEALARRLEEMLDNPQRWLEMGKAGRAHVQANFDIEGLNDRLVERLAAIT